MIEIQLISTNFMSYKWRHLIWNNMGLKENLISFLYNGFGHVYVDSLLNFYFLDPHCSSTGMLLSCHLHWSIHISVCNESYNYGGTSRSVRCNRNEADSKYWIYAGRWWNYVVNLQWPLLSWGLTGWSGRHQYWLHDLLLTPRTGCIETTRLELILK